MISDQRSASEPVRKTLSLTVGDGGQGLVRSNSVFSGGVMGGPVPLHMDATPEILADGKIRVTFGLEYDLPRPEGPDTPALGPNVNRTEIREHLTVVVENGKPLVVSQSADPVSERHVTVELKATILK